MSARTAALVYFAFASCVLGGAPDAAKISAITLERTACYGTCPVYKVTLRRDGTVTYEGKQFVKASGRRSHKISTDRFLRLAQEIRQVGFFALQDEYSHKKNADGSATFVTDLPTTITTVEAGEKRKTVKNYFGGPKRLFDLEQLIDEIAQSNILVGGEARANKDIPYYDSFPLHRVLTFRALLEGSSKTTADALSHPPKYSHYILTFVNNTMSFDLRAPSSIHLPKFNGYIVDATGTLEEDRKTRALIFNVSKVHPVRRYFTGE